MKKNIPLVFMLVLLFVLVFSSTLSVVGMNAKAESGATKLSSLDIGHVSDIHYFPIEYCYQDVKNSDYQSTEYYHSMTGDTKIVLESGVALNATIQGFIADAQAETAPTYVVASGDLSKNGERQALIDVANALRYMQNTIRALGGKYADFQVFATVGNHDLYNGSGALYAKDVDESYIADVVDAATFSLIFAGLGFPDANLDGSNNSVNLTDFFPEDYWSSEYTGGYIASRNSESITYHYYKTEFEQINDGLTNGFANGKSYKDYYFSLGHENNVLSYIAQLGGDNKDYSLIVIDASEREADSTGVPVRISQAEFDAKYAGDDKTAAFNASKFYEANDSGIGVKMTETANGKAVDAHLTKAEVEQAFTDGKPVYIAYPYNHLTGGRIVDNCFNWIENYQKTQIKTEPAAGEVNQESYIAVFHQNVLPHFSQEDEILKDFTMYNWEYVAKTLLKLDVHYVLSGHMHASDVSAYTNAEGKTLYDLETGSTVSYASPRRYMTLTRYNADGALAENIDTSVYVLDDISKIASTNINTAASWNDSAYQNAISTWNANNTPENWNAVISTNPDYLAYIIHYEDFNSESYNEYIYDQLYSQIVDRLLSHFIDRDSLVATLKSAVSGMVESSTALSLFSTLITDLANYAIDELVDNLYDGESYVYNGENYSDIFEYVKAIAGDIVAMQFGGEDFATENGIYNASDLTSADLQPLKLGEMAVFILAAHSSGAEVDLRVLMQNNASDISSAALKNLLTDFTVDKGVDYNVPQNPEYRARFELALIDFAQKCDDGSLVKKLLDKLIEPLLTDENSILKTLLTHEFDLSEALTEQDQSKIDMLLKTAIDYVKKTFNYKKTIKVDIDLKHFVLGDIISELMPVIKSLAASVLNFNVEGDDVIEIAEGFIDDYLVDSFYVGIGGILKQIVVSFATDDYKDTNDIYNLGSSYTLRASENYGIFNGTQYTYLSGAYMSDEENIPTTENGRVPSRVSANFDTVSGSDSITVKFYTAEDVFAGFGLTSNDAQAATGNWDLYTSTADSIAKVENIDGKNLLTRSSSDTLDGVTLNIKTVTTPVYVPFIDLGLACLTHSEINFDNDDSTEWFGYDDRNAVSNNSVIYWNVTTVTVSGLNADTEYYYDAFGVYNYKNYGSDAIQKKSFSLSDKLGADYRTVKTAADRNTDTFEFLTFGDIQGMTKDMYEKSYAAMQAVLDSAAVNGYDFMLNVGDVVDNGKNFSQWGWALDTYANAFTDTSIFTAAGNHESGSYAMADYYNYSLPERYTGQTGENGLFYSFNYGTAHFIVLDTNDADANGLGKNQLNWLRSDLRANNQKWTVVLMHKSVFSLGSHSTDAEIIAMRKQLVPLFNDYGVDIVFGGHDHTYTTTHLVNADMKIAEAADAATGAVYSGSGVMFVTLGTMGTKFYEYSENADVLPYIDSENSVLKTLNTQTFGTVKIQGDLLTYTGYLFDSEENDVAAIGSITISSDKNIAIATLKAKNAEEKTYSISYFDKNCTSSIVDLTYLPNDMSVAYSVDGVEYSNVSDIKISGAAAKIKVLLISPDGTRTEISEVTIEKTNFVLYTTLFALGGFVVLAGIVCAIVFPVLAKKGKLKKKSAKKN